MRDLTALLTHARVTIARLFEPRESVHPDPNHHGLNNGGSKLSRILVSVSLFCITRLTSGSLLASLKATFLASFAGTRSSVKNLTISLVP